MYCAPGVKHENGTCFDRDGLIRIIGKYNQQYPNKKIKYTSQTSNQQLWQSIRNGMASVCGDREWCWLDQDFLHDDSTIQSYYKPPRPSTKYKWLTTGDIDHVLKQYEQIYRDFIFMGTVPIDFDAVIDEYKHMDVCKLRQSGGGYKHSKYGFVFNLDPHDQRGSHWVSMFMTLSGNNPFIGFFDSYGTPPPREIENLIRRIKQQIKQCMGINLRYKCNTVQHQHKNTECGVYSLYFIYQCLQGYSFEEITETIILDDEVNKFRNFFFRPTINYKHS